MFDVFQNKKSKGIVENLYNNHKIVCNSTYLTQSARSTHLQLLFTRTKKRITENIKILILPKFIFGRETVFLKRYIFSASDYDSLRIH